MTASSNGIASNSADWWASRPPLREDLAVDFYADESSQNSHRYLVIGAVCATTAKVPEIVHHFEEYRANSGHLHELKWTHISKHNVRHYQAWVDLFFQKVPLHFTCLVLDTSTFNHNKYNQGDGEIGFNKILYQLLLHSIGKKYGFMRPIYGYLDDRTTAHTPEKLRQMLNAGLAKIHPTKYKAPFRRLTFRDSKTTVLIQMTDILIGAIAFNRNRHSEKPNCRPEKIEMSKQILERMQTKPARYRCHVWDFEFKERSLGPRL